MIHISEAETCVLDSTGWARQGSRTNQNCRPFVRVLRVTDSIYNTLLSNLFSHGHDNWHGVKIDPSLKSQQLATGWRKVLNPQLQGHNNWRRGFWQQRNNNNTSGDSDFGNKLAV
ncbi:hypothetical protein DF185_22905 [Marinifilum breve]|uniref:Uncharacterized protein n=1 Tax=Marinifilum breve TaxID=2184082 RepID=A0A2V3ZQY5_9BACT|nr:hypothetical protein DF185_22905 [Marinifilum breve]